jgi:hypothetical protein
MWRETDSWFELLFSDNTIGYAHLDNNGNYIGVFYGDGTPVTGENIGYTCVNDNAEQPSWFTA